MPHPPLPKVEARSKRPGRRGQKAEEKGAGHEHSVRDAEPPQDGAGSDVADRRTRRGRGSDRHRLHGRSVPVTGCGLHVDGRRRQRHAGRRGWGRRRATRGTPCSPEVSRRRVSSPRRSRLLQPCSPEVSRRRASFPRQGTLTSSRTAQVVIREGAPAASSGALGADRDQRRDLPPVHAERSATHRDEPGSERPGSSVLLAIGSARGDERHPRFVVGATEPRSRDDLRCSYGRWRAAETEGGTP